MLVDFGVHAMTWPPRHGRWKNFKQFEGPRDPALIFE